MRPLTASDAISIWEAGSREASAEQAMTVLAAAFPEVHRDELRRLTLGQRNARLLELRKRLLGPRLNAFSECANCAERLEFTLDCGSLRRNDSSANANSEFHFESEGYEVRFRALNSEDLSAVAGDEIAAVRKLLLKRCVLDVRRGDDEVSVENLPDSVVAALSQRLADSDPNAEVLIDLVCPACDVRQELPFDIAAFLWTEVALEAQRLLREVHALAWAYGWHEQDILQMNARRRQFYLQMLEQ